MATGAKRPSDFSRCGCTTPSCTHIWHPVRKIEAKIVDKIVNRFVDVFVNEIVASAMDVAVEASPMAEGARGHECLLAQEPNHAQLHLGREVECFVSGPSTLQQ